MFAMWLRRRDRMGWESQAKEQDVQFAELTMLFGMAEQDQEEAGQTELEGKTAANWKALWAEGSHGGLQAGGIVIGYTFYNLAES
jgi:hypothetical protein